MSDDISRQSHAIFVKTLELESSRRDDYIRRACAGNGMLEAKVRRLLGALDRSTGFLEQPALGARYPESSRPAVVEPSLIHVPGYRPVRIIGVGGMATVYEAVQRQPERTVALKVMNRGLESASAVRRFKYETEVLARLQHPGIAQIFEAGTCDDNNGRAMPFFAMELVPCARTIIEHAAVRALSIRERLSLFAEACDAVQHGHQIGVIHRDLKPGNVLVNESGRVKVIDFGIARRVEVAGTGSEQTESPLFGTLNYMSPEQCALSVDIDARTDVYSLGVILFELLAGRLPHDFSGRSVPEAVRVIAECDAPSARAIRPELDRDLDAIVGKALCRDRARRYSGADAFAADIRRFLGGFPVEARHAGSLETFGKLVRRHRPLSAAIGLLAVTLVAGTAVSSRYAYVAAQARDAAVQRGQELEAAAAFQESMLGGVNAAQMGDRLRRSISDRIGRAAGGGSAGASAAADFDQLSAKVNFTSVAIQSLNEGVLQRYRESIDAQLIDQPLLRGRLLQQLANTMNLLGLHTEAEPVLVEALAIRRHVLGNEHPDTLQSIHALGSLRVTLGQLNEALTLLIEAYDGRAKVLGEEHVLTLRAATSLGGAYRRMGDLVAAERVWAKNLAAQRRTIGSDDPSTLRTLNNMGVVYAAQGRWRDAESCWSELHERARRVFGETSAEYLGSLGNLGVILHDRGKLDESRELIEQAVAADRRRYGDRHANTLVSVSQLASLEEDTGHLEEAERLYRECYDGRLSTAGAVDSGTLRSKAALASVMHRRGERVQSVRMMSEVLEAQRRELGAADSDTIVGVKLSALMKREAGAFDEAIQIEQQALELARKHLADEPWTIGEILSQHGITLMQAGRHEESKQALIEAYRLLDTSFGPRNLDALSAARALSEIFAAAHARQPGAGHDAEAARWNHRAEHPEAEGDSNATRLK